MTDTVPADTGPAAAPGETLAPVLRLLGVPAPGQVTVLKDVGPVEIANWLVARPGGEPAVLRRYNAQATPADLAWEHAVLRHLARAGWTVPEPVSDLVSWSGRHYCLTRYVPGGPAVPESADQRRRRGRDLARLHVALRGLGERLGQRPGWQAQHEQAGVTVHSWLDWAACLAALSAVSPGLTQWAHAAAADVARDLAAVGAAGLPVQVVHGDFAEWNVHYAQGRLTGVLDFGLAHCDSRPYELAIARTYRAPETAASYRAELHRAGWPLSDLEEAAAGPVYRAFRLDMAVWPMEQGRLTGRFDLPMIERQLARTGTPRPGAAGA